MKTVTVSPHLHCGKSTRGIMLTVVCSLIPALIWGIIVFGFKALLVVCISIISAVLTEFLLGKISKENTISDCSALLTGLLIGLNMSASVPLFIPVIASVFAIAVVKWTFGGLGCNWANPAIAGRVFVFFSFTSYMSSFPMPLTLKAVNLTSSATPLSLIKTYLSSGAQGSTSLQIMKDLGYPISNFSLALGQKTGLNPYVLDSFIGNIQGCIGEVSALLLLAGGLFLLYKKVITYHIPVFYLLTFSVFTWIFGGIPLGLGFFKGEILSSLFRGGLFLGAFFMATDYVTTPVTHKGMIVFAIGCGLLNFLFRTFGSLPEATSVAILIMNITVPTIDRFIKPKRFGEVIKEEQK